MKNRQRGAIHIISLSAVAILIGIFFLATFAKAHVDRLEQKVAEQSELINKLETKVKILEVKVGL